MRPFLYLIAFAAAIWAIGEGWAALLGAWAAPTATNLAVALGYSAVFVVAFLYIGLWIYAADRAGGKVRRRIGLYEWILTRRPQGPGTRTGGRDAMRPGR